MKLLLVTSLLLGAQLFAATPEPTTTAELLSNAATIETVGANGFCEDSVACPDGQHTAYCKAEGPFTRCGKWGSYGVRCVAWNHAGKYTVASQSCP